MAINEGLKQFIERYRYLVFLNKNRYLNQETTLEFIDLRSRVKNYGISPEEFLTSEFAKKYS